MIYASPNEIMPVKTGWPAIFSITATSATVMNFGQGEVAEGLQCMSDWDLSGTMDKQTDWQTIRLLDARGRPFRPGA